MMQKLASITLLFLLFSSVNAAGDSREKAPGELDAASVLKEIDEKIHHGEDVSYDNKTIIGNLDFVSLNLSAEDGSNELGSEICSKRIFPSEIRIINSRIIGTVLCNDTCFSKPIALKNTTFIGNVRFDNSEFRDDIDLSGAIFKGVTNFNESYFIGGFYCRDTSFIDVVFDGSGFYKYTTFAGSDFHDASFTDVHFNCSDADFGKCEFKDSIDFSSSQFHPIPNFMDSKFEGNAFFNQANFSSASDFSNLIFEGSVDYSQAIFNNFADFTNTKFNNYAIFRSAEFKRNAYFDNSRFSNDAFFDSVKLSQHISLSQTNYQKFYIRWKNIADRLVYNDEAYLSLIENYKNLGWFEDANDCYYKYRCEYRRVNYDFSPPSIRELNQGPKSYISQWQLFFVNSLFYWIPDSLFMAINGYGVIPSRPFFWMLLIVPLFGIIFWATDRIPFWSAMKFSVVVFLSGSGKLFVEAPDYKPNPKGRHSLATFSITMFYLERILGMMIFIALLVAFGKTVLR